MIVLVYTKPKAQDQQLPTPILSAQPSLNASSLILVPVLP